MKSPIILILAGLLSIAVALIVLAQPEPAIEKPAAGPIAANEQEQAEPPLSAMMQQIRDLSLTEQATLAELQARLGTLTDENEILALMREIEQLKIETELQILLIQADFARRDGRIEQAQQIEAAVESMREGPPRRIPQVRPDQQVAPDPD
jgi:hypothetical protein